MLGNTSNIVENMQNLTADLFIFGAKEVVTCTPHPNNPLGRISNGAVAVANGEIIAVGSQDEIKRTVDISHARHLDLENKIIAPGFVDCHTHVVFAGSRAKEFSLTMTKTTDEIEAMGIRTGIPASIAMTRNAEDEEIFNASLDRLQRMFLYGSTTIESKTGYGISLDDEFRLLRINDTLKKKVPADIVSTFTGAHDFPPEINRDNPAQRQKYIELLIHKMIPKVAQEKLAGFCDVYCDTGYYTADEAKQILEVGINWGLVPRIHTDAYANIGGSTMAAQLPALTADHLNYTTRQEMKMMAKSGVIGVILPALDFAVKHPDPVRARDLIDEGVTIALGTNLNPGNWTESMQFVMQLACRNHGMSLTETLMASTIGAAKALGLEQEIGSIEKGKKADLQIWNIGCIEDLIYRLGNNAVTLVIKAGEIYRSENCNIND